MKAGMKVGVVIALGLFFLSGCKSSCKVSKKEGEPVEGSCEVSGEWYTQQASNYLRPIANLLAYTEVFDIQDWQSLDVSAINLTLSESQSTTSISNNKVTVRVYSSDILVGEKLFDVVKSGTTYKFVSPAAVKTWSETFIDYADRVAVDFAANSTGTPGAQTTVSAVQNGVVKASTSWTSVSYGSIDGGGGATQER